MHENERISEAVFGLTSLVISHRSRDLSLTAQSTLGTLDRGGPIRLGDLALNQGITQPSMTGLVGQLEQLGLVERRSDPGDGRAVLVAITPAGRRNVVARRKASTAGLGALIGQLQEDEVEALMAAIPAMNHLVDLAAARPLRQAGRVR